MNDVITILDQLTAGEVTTEQAAEAFGALPWPARLAADTFAATETDPDPEPEDGGFVAIEAAYLDGQITAEQYAAIVTAIERGAPERIAD